MTAESVLRDVLRVTEHMDASDALFVESLAYSTLLGGPEFAAWLAARPPMVLPPTDDEPVLLQRDGDERVITLNRPERNNAFGAAMRDALVDALELAIVDTSLHVTLRGNGRSFCSGGDLAEFGTTPDVLTAHHVRTERSAGRLIHALADRITVEVKGACVGAGIELAAFAGRVVAHPRTFFRLPEVAMGLIPGAGGTVSIPRRIGLDATAELAITGRRLRADQALALGLIDAIH